MADAVWTIARLLTWTTDFFREHGIENPRLDAEVLLSAVLGKDRMYLYVHFDEPLEPAELAQFRVSVKERAARMPLAYVLGRREFMGLDFRVTRDTLIPRPDTEVLVPCTRGKRGGRSAYCRCWNGHRGDCTLCPSLYGGDVRGCRGHLTCRRRSCAGECRGIGAAGAY